MNSYIEKVAKKFNNKYVNLFTQKGASKRFLTPFGLTLNSICLNSSFENKRTKLSKEEEIQLFKSLHFIKFKMNCVLNIKNKIEQYYRIYIILRNRVISSHIDIIPICLNKIIRKVKNSTDMAFLEERGYTALIHAADRFDPWRGYQFNTYAGTSVVHSFFDKKLIDKRFFESFVSINAKEEDIEDSEKEQNNNEEHQILTEVLTEVLTEKEKIVIHHRFLSNKTMTLEKIGKIFDIGCSETCRKIQNSSLEKLKNYLLDNQKI